MRCSFCDISSDESQNIVQKGEHFICAECVTLAKEIISEFSMGQVLEGRGRCSFCHKEHGGGRTVFQGKTAVICNECIEGIEREMRSEKNNELSRRATEVREIKTAADSMSPAKSRVKKGVQKLSAYSVPHHECGVKLDGNESPFSLPAEVLEKVLKALREVPINRYPDSYAGSLKEKISGIESHPSEGIILGNGSDELIAMLMTAFSGGTGRLLYPTPTFSMFRIMGTALGLELVEVELDEKFDIEIGETIKKIERKDPDLIFLASPNNPTGNCFSDDRIFEILNRSRGIVVVDEAYCEFAGKTFLREIERYENLVVLRTMSKVGFAGIRIGILFGREEIVREINKVRLPYNVNSLSQRVAEAVLDNPEFVEENVQLIIRERDRVYGVLKAMHGVRAFRSDANFILLRVPDADRVYEELIARDVLIRNFNSPGRLKGCVRVTIGTPEENDTFLRALGEILSL